MIVFRAATSAMEHKRYPSDPDALATLIHDTVGGFFELLPHKQGDAAPFVAYANETGMLDNLTHNPLAWGVLQHLGFDHSVNNLGYYHGNVVLLGRDEQSLTSKDRKQVKDAQQRYLTALGDAAEDEDDDYAPVSESDSPSQDSSSSSSVSAKVAVVVKRRPSKEAGSGAAKKRQKTSKD